MKCPNCGNKSIRKSMRSGWEKAVPFFRPYRCVNCRHRFWWLKVESKGTLVQRSAH